MGPQKKTTKLNYIKPKTPEFLMKYKTKAFETFVERKSYIEKGNEETHTHKDCFGENTIKMIMIPIFYIFMICVFNLFLLYMLKIVSCERE